MNAIALTYISLQNQKLRVKNFLLRNTLAYYAKKPWLYSENFLAIGGAYLSSVGLTPSWNQKSLLWNTLAYNVKSHDYTQKVILAISGAYQSCVR